MILEVHLNVPESWEVGPEARVTVARGCEVRDPATGVVGSVTHARLNWKDSGDVELIALLEVNDAAVAEVMARMKRLSTF